MYLWAPGGRRAGSDHHLEYYRRREVHMDSTLAPRLTKAMYGRPGGKIVWSGSGVSNADRQNIYYGSDECPQGQFLRHELDSGFTALSWWDRNQGDHRGGINSALLLEGVRTSDEVLAAGRLHFPRVFENLSKAGVELVEVHLL